ncbi:MAG TPA: hypothetical protein VFV87_06545 [Pirellulaceae bacterium]|nr:hypothetical protein [Pirellulaceae bacterium]
MQNKVFRLLAAWTLFFLAAMPAAAQVRFSIGAGGVSVGNAPRYGYNPYRYGPGYPYGGRSYPGGTVVIGRGYSAPVTRYVERAPVAYAVPGVMIRNPEATGVALSYTIDSRHAYEIAAGEAQQLPEKGSYLVEFDRGGEFGQARYTITEGLYEFALTDHGWELYRQPDSATSDQRVKANPLPELATPE